MEKKTHNITTIKYVGNNIVHPIVFYCMSHKLNNYVKYEKDKKSIACPICVHRVEYKASLISHITEHNTQRSLS